MPEVAFDPDCDFCQIARSPGSETEVICEGESWVAFFPTDPATPGHTLVIPRSHVPDAWSLDPALGGDLMAAVVKVGQAIERALAPEGMNLISSSGEVAEQTVFHLHLHVVPRWHRDGFGRIWPMEQPTEREEIENLADLIRVECAD
jgi:diadenosine tetraphosphate (Ap4A) HIT family hydrolase